MTRLSATALGGTVTTVVMICATMAEFTFTPTTEQHFTSPPSPLILHCNPRYRGRVAATFYITIFEGPESSSNVPLIIGSVQLGVGILDIALFGIIPPFLCSEIA